MSGEEPVRGGPSEEDILKALHDSGYLMEQDVATQFERFGYHVVTNKAFEDNEEGKSREIDVSAVKRVLFDEEQKIAVYVEFIIECKNTNNPFVFIKRPKNASDLHHNVKEIIFPKKQYYEVIENTSYYRDGFNFFGFNEHHYYSKQRLKAVQFSRIDRKGSGWQANHSGVYDALLMPLAKAFAARRDQIPRHENSGDWTYVWMLIPTVVIRGEIYEVDASEQPPTIARTDHVTFLREFKGKQAEGKFLFEFVSESGLDEFVNRKVESSAAAFCRIVESDPKRLTTTMHRKN